MNIEETIKRLKIDEDKIGKILKLLMNIILVMIVIVILGTTKIIVVYLKSENKNEILNKTVKEIIWNY